MSYTEYRKSQTSDKFDFIVSSMLLPNVHDRIVYYFRPLACQQ